MRIPYKITCQKNTKTFVSRSTQGCLSSGYYFFHKSEMPLKNESVNVIGTVIAI